MDSLQKRIKDCATELKAYQQANDDVMIEVLKEKLNKLIEQFYSNPIKN